MNKNNLFELNNSVTEIETRIYQLEKIKDKSPSQKFELKVLKNHLEEKRKQLANSMFSHDSMDDLIELCGLNGLQ